LTALLRRELCLKYLYLCKKRLCLRLKIGGRLRGGESWQRHCY
jgi:hypothetical protein